MKAILQRCCSNRLFVAALVSALCLPLLPAAGRNVLSIADPPPVTVKRGGEAVLALRAKLLPGYHVNSNTPSDEYLIPLKLSWQAAPLEVIAVDFPDPVLEDYSFSDGKLSVFTGDFDIKTTFRAPATAPPGAHTITGKLSYQACSDKLCLPPKTLPVRVEIRVE